MPCTLRNDLTRWAVQVFPWPVRIPIRFKDAATCSSDHRAAMPRQSFVWRAAAMFPSLWFTHPQLRMLAAPPMDRQDDLTHRFVDIDDDVGGESAQKLLTCAHGDVRRVPCRFEVIGEPG